MHKNTICIIVLAIALVGLCVPASFSSDANSLVVTYGETTFANNNYKSVVDSFFENQANANLNDAQVKVISASEVNQISGSISQKTYNSNQIFSSALLDLNDNGNLQVDVDKSKITTITAEMYASALKSAGITKGHVYVSSPITATGESALAGIMNSYEEATDIEIPDSVKQAANDEIYTEASIVNNSNVSADEVSDLVDEVKETVINQNITDHDTIVNMIYNYTVNNNINISNSDIENLASTIEQIQSVQGDAQDYQDQISKYLGDNNTFSLDGLLNWFTSIFN